MLKMIYKIIKILKKLEKDYYFDEYVKFYNILKKTNTLKKS